MSMTVYPVKGSDQSLTATDLKTAAGIVVPDTGGMPAYSRGGAVTITQDREVTKAGSTRIMVKVAYKAPFRDTASGTASENPVFTMGEISAHCVLTVPKAVTNALIYETTGAIEDSTTSTSIVWVVAALTALINNQSLNTLPATASDVNPLIQGIIGKLPLNVDSGEYGSAS